MRILVTGVTGFAGGWLCEALLAEGVHQVHGLSRHGEWPRELLHLEGKVRLHSCDLSDRAAIERLLAEVVPDQIYHLAGYANVGRSFQEVEAAWTGNLAATRCLYEAVASWGGRPRILAVSSALIYGDSGVSGHPLDEETPLRPNSPYGASKAAADLVSYQYSRSHALDIVRVRPFNHIGPRQSPQFAVGNFARQLALIQLGKQPPTLETGDLSACRDLSDVRDIAAAYLLVMEKGRTGEAYNVASGRSCSMQQVLDQLVVLAGIPVEVRRRSDLLRAADPSQVVASIDKIQHEIGWHPSYSLVHTLKDTLEYWRLHL